MEDEIEDLGDSKSGVRISVTRASVSEDEEDLAYLTKLDQDGNERTGSRSDTIESMDSDIDKIAEDDGENGQLNEKERNSTTRSENQNGSLADALQNGVTISDDKVSKSPTLEMVGDRVLIERDGKFELIDASEIKAEYFEMLGLDKGHEEAESSKKNLEKDSEISEDKSPTFSHKQENSEASGTKERPKTSGLERTSRNNSTSPKKKSPNRSQSAKPLRQTQSDEYSYIKSRYAMTEQQLEIKRKREEAIGRRRKEEEARELEEERRKREDAERAFEAWLIAKNEEAKEHRKESEKNKADPGIPIQRAENAQSAYDEWLRSKRQQTKSDRELERSRIEEEAAQYLIRDRELCDEAFKRWVRKKGSDARAKAAAKKKKKKPKKQKNKESLPLNSDKIRFYEYHGYRNTVVLSP